MSATAKRMIGGWRPVLPGGNDARHPPWMNSVSDAIYEALVRELFIGDQSPREAQRA